MNPIGTMGDSRVLPFEPKEDGEKATGFLCLICDMNVFETSWELAEHLEAHEEN